MLNKFFTKHFCKIIIFSCIFILILLQFNSKSIINEKYINEPNTESRCRAIPQYQPEKQMYCENVLMNECDDDEFCETY